MEKHIEKLMLFLKMHDPSKELNTLSKDDQYLKEKWKQVQSTGEWRKIKSSEDVKYLIDCFEKSVETLPFDIRERNEYKYDVLIAQYQAMRGMRKWCESINNISILKDLNYSNLTKIEVDELILRLKRIMNMI